MITRSPVSASAAAATATLLIRQKPIARSASAWCPGGRATTNATSPAPAASASIAARPAPAASRAASQDSGPRTCRDRAGRRPPRRTPRAPADTRRRAPPRAPRTSRARVSTSTRSESSIEVVDAGRGRADPARPLGMSRERVLGRGERAGDDHLRHMRNLASFRAPRGGALSSGARSDDAPAREDRWFDPHEAVGSTIPRPRLERKRTRLGQLRADR